MSGPVARNDSMIRMLSEVSRRAYLDNGGSIDSFEITRTTHTYA